MKNLISILFVVLSFYSCSDLGDENVQDCGKITSVAFSELNICSSLNKNPEQASFLIINSKEEFDKVFTVCPTFNVLDLPDFTQKRILGLLAGPKPSSGYGIKIQSVVEDNCQITVDYYEREPKDDETVLSVITYPSDYIVLPKSSKPILFRKVTPVDYAVVGIYYGYCAGTDCQQFFRIENDKVLRYLNVNYNSYDFNQYSYKTLGFKDDLLAFLSKIPTELAALKGQTKTFGLPDSHDQGGVYFEWSQEGIVTRIYLDNDNSTDQSQDVVNFKKTIQDKIAELKTKS